MDRKGTGFAGLVLVGLLTLGTACGGGSDKESSSSEGKVTATTAASSNSDSSDSDSGSKSNGSDDVASVRDFLDSDCQAAIAAYSSIFTSGLTGASGVSDEQREQLEDEVATLKEKVPSELEDDIATVSAAYKAYFDAIGDLDLADLAKPGASNQIEKASQQLDSSEFKDAQTNIEDFFTDNCPTMAGSLGG